MSSMASTSEKRNYDDYPWVGETFETMKVRHERDTKSLYETEGRDIAKEQSR